MMRKRQREVVPRGAATLIVAQDATPSDLRSEADIGDCEPQLRSRYSQGLVRANSSFDRSIPDNGDAPAINGNEGGEDRVGRRSKDREGSKNQDGAHFPSFSFIVRARLEYARFVSSATFETFQQLRKHSPGESHARIASKILGRFANLSIAMVRYSSTRFAPTKLPEVSSLVSSKLLKYFAGETLV